MSGADATFAAVANAAAAAFAAVPAYVTYDVAVESRRGDVRRDGRFDVALRTSDGRATVTAPDGTHRNGDPPVLPPAVDALAAWAFSLDERAEKTVMHVAYQRPKTYAFASPGPNVDVVVPSIVGYSVRFASDDPSHLELAPATNDVRADAAQPDHFVYRDVFFDAATLLPTRVVVAAPGETLTLDYGVLGGFWILSHLAYDAAKRGTHGATIRAAIDATYENYAFPTIDPR